MHQNSIKAIQLEYPVFGEAVQLFSFWLGKHHLSGHICTEVIEILTAEEFLYPTTFQAPTTPLIAFYRTLQRLIRHNWEETPFILDLNLTEKEINTEIRNNIYLQFRSNRAYQKSEMEKPKSKDGNDLHLDYLSPMMYIVTSNDKINNYLPSFIDPKQVPEKVVFNLMIHFAKSTMETIKSYLGNHYLDYTSFHYLDQNINENGQKRDESSAVALVNLRENDEKRTEKKTIVWSFFEMVFSSKSVLNHCQLIFEFKDSLVLQNLLTKCGQNGDSNSKVFPKTPYYYDYPTLTQLEIFKNIPINELSVQHMLPM
jgi:hypothetical protein